MADDARTAGTTVDEHQGGNAAETQTAGTGAASTADGNAETVESLRTRLNALEAEKGQWLTEKGNYEDLKRRAEQAGQGQAQPPTMGANPLAQALYEEEVDLIQRAYAGDRSAMYSLALKQRQDNLEAENKYLRELTTTPEAERAEVEAIAKREGVSLAIARRLRKADQADDLERRAKALEAQNAASQPRTVANAPARMTADEVSSGNALKFSDYVAKRDALLAAGDEAGAAALVKKKDSGTLKILY